MKHLDKILTKMVLNHKKTNRVLMMLYIQPLVILAILLGDTGKFLILSSLLILFHLWVQSLILKSQGEEIDTIITAGTELVLEEYEFKNNKQKEKKC